MANCKEDRMPVILEEDEYEVEIMKKDDHDDDEDDVFKLTDAYDRPLMLCL